MSVIASYVGGACVLNLGDVPPWIGLAAIEIGGAVDLRQPRAGQRFSVPAWHVGMLRERRSFGNREVGHTRCSVTPVRSGGAEFLEYEL